MIEGRDERLIEALREAVEALEVARGFLPTHVDRRALSPAEYFEIDQVERAASKGRAYLREVK